MILGEMGTPALYKTQIRPCLEYGSHLRRGPSKHSLASLDAIQRLVISPGAN